jgi:hypothetical protein
LRPDADGAAAADVFEGPVEDSRVAVGFRAPPIPGVELPLRRAEDVTVRGADVVRPIPIPIPGTPVGVAGLLDGPVEEAGLSQDEKKSSPASAPLVLPTGVPVPEPFVGLPVA